MFWRSSEKLELVDYNRFDYYREYCGPLGVDQTPVKYRMKLSDSV